MLRGLADRRVAVVVPKNEAAQRRASVVVKAFEAAGARVHALSGTEIPDADLVSETYAALVLVGDGEDASALDPRVVQLAREFLASEKSVAVWGSAIRVIVDAGGARGRSVAGDAVLKPVIERAGANWVDAPMHVDDALITASAAVRDEEFATRVVKEFANQLEERALDEMSELSFPASDPPSVSPSSIGSLPRERQGDAGT